MIRHTYTARLILALCTALAAYSDAQANVVRYVGSKGKDANPCTLAAPCRTLQRGVNVTPADGELRVLDSGSYGQQATVGKSLTIAGDHVTLTATSILVASGNAVVVDLRGLDLNGPGPGTQANGVSVQSANAVVNIEGCAIHRFYEGILIAANARVTVTDSVVRDNLANGLYVRGAPGARLTVDNSRFENNGFNGIVVHSGAATITRSIVSGMSSSGGTGISVVEARANISATTSAHNQYGYYAQSSHLTLDSASAWGNSAYGMMVGGGATVRLSGSAVTDNGIGIAVFGNGQALSRGNNTISGNQKDVDGVLTPLPGI
jgi:hypothetical protein